MSEVVEAGAVPNPIVRCQFSSLQEPGTLYPHPKNPNEHPEKQLDMFIAILRFQGWRRPITVSTRSNFVTKGHGALLSALRAGFTEVPVEYQDYDSEEQELADIVADNALQRMSEMNTGKLKTIMVDLKKTESLQLELTGFETLKIDKLLGIKPSKEEEVLAGAPVEPGSEFEGESIGDQAETPEDVPPTPAPEVEGATVHEGRVASNNVRMVQLFFTEKDLNEFMELTHFFQEEFSIDNTTDVVLEVLRRAKAGYEAE